MGIFRAIDISSSGLTAESLRMDVISNNIANVNTTRTESGEPFRRQMVIFEARGAYGQRSYLDKINPPKAGRGVRVNRIMEDMSPFKLEYEPNHPDADENGYVRRPNISIVHEMVDMISATRAYEANVTCINSAKDINSAALSISRGA
ncbi:MAG: flagellar basal body rod protein FlgC [Candidatus Riflebacteria bacterium]|nr:flagellar basal body rod protein FlgC [Candidatus Riflebacteria bacterium]